MTKTATEVSSSRVTTRQILLIGFAFIAGFVILGVAGIQVWEYTNSVAFCSYACHDVHPEEIGAYKDSYHAQVKCVECHMGRLGTLQSMQLKVTHAGHLPAVIFGNYERPLESASMRPANESCERCHWPAAFHGDRVVEIRHFEPDEDNLEKSIFLIMKTAAGVRARGLDNGIHWHIINQVEFIATDERKQDIRWVRTQFPDGRVVEFQDVTKPLSQEEIARGEKHVMDCVDCHNRVGHPFPYPDRSIDQAMAEGRINPELPYAKRYMSELLNAEYPDQVTAMAAVDRLEDLYSAEYPAIAAQYEEDIREAAEVGKELLARLVFEEPGVSWRDFPDNSQHKEFAGCFRCHDGKHLSDEGESIRLHCNICHSIPVTVRADSPLPKIPLGIIEEPAFHLETNFIADHRFIADESCGACHNGNGIQFGTDDSSFCANSACHGTAWPAVDLDAAFPHPIPLLGAHETVWCHDCHQGIQKPVYACSNCHQPPTDPHFGLNCEECHTETGFGLAELQDFEHPTPLEGAHASLSCSSCHSPGETLTYQCSTCHAPPKEPHFGPNCEECHTTTSFKGATIPVELHPIPLIGAHLRATCSVCHAEGQRVPEYICSNCHRPPQDHLPGECEECHTPMGWAESAAAVSTAPAVTHPVAGREDCLLCHDPEGKIRPAPNDHLDWKNDQCLLCHKPQP